MQILIPLTYQNKTCELPTAQRLDHGIGCGWPSHSSFRDRQREDEARYLIMEEGVPISQRICKTDVVPDKQPANAEMNHNLCGGVEAFPCALDVRTLGERLLRVVIDLDGMQDWDFGAGLGSTACKGEIFLQFFPVCTDAAGE